jgi:hypothetical protein
MELETAHADYWASIIRVYKQIVVPERQNGDSDPVVKEVDSIVEGQTMEQLKDLLQQVNRRRKDPEVFNQGFWEQLEERVSLELSRLQIALLFNRAIKIFGDMESDGYLPPADDDTLGPNAGESDTDESDTFLKAEDGPDDVQLSWPRYQSHVIKGYNWTRYNRIHYNRENLPPKHITGYRFRIFYPLLKNKTRVPKFKIVYDDEDGKSALCTLIFQAGAPYQDISFRIVNRPWDRSLSLRGSQKFVCQFNDGILDLHFRFKKIFSK